MHCRPEDHPEDRHLAGADPEQAARARQRRGAEDKLEQQGPVPVRTPLERQVRVAVVCRPVQLEPGVEALRSLLPERRKEYRREPQQRAVQAHMPVLRR